MLAFVEGLINCHADNVGPFDIGLDDPFDQAEHSLLWGQEIVIRTIQHRQDFIRNTVEHHLVEFLFGLEIVIDQLLGHASGLGDVVQPSAIEAMLGKGVTRGGQNAIQRLRRGMARLILGHAGILARPPFSSKPFLLARRALPVAYPMAGLPRARMSLGRRPTTQRAQSSYDHPPPRRS